VLTIVINIILLKESEFYMFLKIKAVIYKQFKTGISYLETKRKQLDKHPILQLLTLSIALTLILEMLSQRSIKGLGFIIANPLMFLFNVMIILLTLSVTIMFSRKKFLIALITIIWLGLGVGNFALLGFRTTPLTAMDFIMLKSVFGIIHVYLNTFQIILFLVIVAIVILAMAFLWMKLRKNKAQFKMPLIMICILTVLMLVVSNISLKVNALSTNYGNLADAYSEYGFAYCFSISLFDRGINEPDEYSEENVDAVLEKIEVESNEIDTNKEDLKETELIKTEESNPLETNKFEDQNSSELRPNIIMVQLESFFDVNHLLDYTFSENPIPNFTQLKKTYSSGYLTVPSIGAGTANTEFEIITGMDIEYFGAGEYPYKTILQSTTCESICYNLDELGYHSHAIHNNAGTFYDRNKVFQKLGFDSFSSIEYMNNVEYNPIGWAKDNILTSEILKELKARDTRDFIYTISVQPHGKYPDTVVDENQKIKVIVDPKKRQLFDSSVEENDSKESILEEDSTKESNLEGNDTEKSVIEENDTEKINTEEIKTADSEENDIEEIDESYKNGFEYYVNQLAETDRFIGELIDKLSVCNEPTIVIFYGDHLPSLSFENEDLVNNNKFQTEYVMWDNFGMEQVNRDLNAYQLNAYVMERLGYDTGILTKFHQRYVREPDYHDELKLLQYDMLYGSKNVFQGENPYIEKTMQMGVFEIAITNVREKGEVLYIEGENFTPWSVVYIDEKPKETLFVDKNTLIVPYEKFTDEGIYVAQVTDNNIVLSQSKEWKSLK